MYGWQLELYRCELQLSSELHSFGLAFILPLYVGHALPCLASEYEHTHTHTHTRLFTKSCLQSALDSPPEMSLFRMSN